jgi:coenzyme Q-binding protein COQ10
MAVLALERHVVHLPRSMFELVGDLANYPNFIRNVKAMEVRPDGVGKPNVRLARMTLNFGPITQAYTSRVVMDPEALTITAKAIDGPFQYLDSQWSFMPVGQGTRVHFDIDFKFSNPLVAAVADPAFAAKQEELIDSFVEEADRRFGR